ncbi:hypothetical protein [Alistipes indistinctus]|uniref:hypothetical protein n=1 Tax=Alistipes indistinctus TaxID=626932 RepID=UPI003A86DA92
MEFKRIMTFNQMQKHLTEHTCLIPSRVTVGKYARRNGFRPYKPMIGGRLRFYYVNETIPEPKEKRSNAK